MRASVRRAVACAALAASGAFALQFACRKQAESPEPAPNAAATDAQTSLAQDPRLDYLLVPCAKSETYDVNTSDAIAILTETLLHGQRDPLRHAREELATTPEGIAAVARIAYANFSGLDSAGPLRNVIDVLTRSGDPGAREVLLRLIENPEQAVAVLAAGGLKKHGRPADYDAVRALFDATTYEFRSKVADVLYSVDPRRAELQYVQWMEAGEFEGLWPEFVLKLAAATDPRIVGRCLALASKLGPRYQIPLITPAARAGDEQELARLRATLHADNPDLRRMAISCLIAAGLDRELVETAHKDPDPAIRLLAVSALARPELVGTYRAELSAALGDGDDEVANVALRTLCEIGDATAIDRALDLLDDPGPGAMANGLRGMRVAMEKDPALAKRAFERLSARRVSEAQLPFEARTPVLQAIGQTPCVEAARALHELSRDATGTIFGMPTSRWLMMQAGNTCAAAQPYFRAQLDLEKDPLRRLDLLEALAVRGGATARDALIELIDGDSLSPYETLYTAERLTRMGPVEVVAPVLKRVTLRVKQGDVRLALQCLLWANYPGPK
jgi:hypothetical protein